MFMRHKSHLVLLCVLMAPPSLPAQGSDTEMSKISGSAATPRRHYRLRNPAALEPEQAEVIYGIAKHSLRVGYARSGMALAQNYLSFKRYSKTPYLSATHGNHYVNNYANATAGVYGRYEDAGLLPAGSAVIKDSFSVTESGGILLGPMFLMEKMPAGFNPVSGDWRYTLVNPDGTILGTTNGDGGERVRYCITCHLAVEHQDHLYFIPQQLRAVD